ncbi:hypothetical protein RFN57_32130 [Streptomyces violaceochromogenes]|uniref:Uncharacterized protein n=1 Tax=Streptomyces violaceochromogenes TaxID=67377 RepID=A0ABU6M919_9ACTN|nr:hypothetical protein [Streptomyces violaceochromogenes]MEC7056906.1 hypothetical protein [Streptomyces violaceochromogenes]GHC88394.1 hypothetical protein GCM10010309_68880 [Streptomyces violaceochromogenes]
MWRSACAAPTGPKSSGTCASSSPTASSRTPERPSDLKTGELHRIDAADPAAFTAFARLSADNRHLAFASADPGDTNRTTRAYVRDLRTGRTALASPDAQGGPNDQSVSAPVIDRHGRTVAFGSASPDLVPGDTYDTSHVYIRHLK